MSHRKLEDGASKVLHDIQTISHGYNAEPNYIESGIEKVLAMRRRQHQMLVRTLGVIVQSDVLTSLFKDQRSRRRHADRERWFSVELVRELARRNHGFGMSARSG